MKPLSFIFIVLFCFTLNAQEITRDDITKLVTEMEQKYAIKFKVDSMPKTTWDTEYKFAQEQDYSNLVNYLHLVDIAFSKYPLTFLKKVKLKSVIFVKNLKLKSSKEDLTTSAIPDYQNNILIFDFIIGYYDKVYQEHTIHHTFYKFIESQFNSKLNWNDPVWNSFNKSNESYGVQGIDSSGINNSIKGYVSSYSLYNATQDKAEIFATLFTKLEHKSLKKWMVDDLVLSNKARYLQDFLKGIDRNFNDEYWRKLNE